MHALLWVLVIAGWLMVCALMLISFVSGGRLLPFVIGVALLGVAVAMWVLPMGLGAGLDCGSLNSPRFPGLEGAPAESMAARCQDSGNAWGEMWFAALTGGVGSVFVSVWRSIGGRRTLIFVVGLAIILSSLAVMPEHGGSGTALRTGAILTGCVLVAGPLTRALGRDHRGLAVVVWTVTMGTGIYLIVRDVGWRGVVLIVTVILFIGLSAASLVTETGDD